MGAECSMLAMRVRLHGAHEDHVRGQQVANKWVALGRGAYGKCLGSVWGVTAGCCGLHASRRVAEGGRGSAWGRPCPGAVCGGGHPNERVPPCPRPAEPLTRPPRDLVRTPNSARRQDAEAAGGAAPAALAAAPKPAAAPTSAGAKRAAKAPAPKAAAAPAANGAAAAKKQRTVKELLAKAAATGAPAAAPAANGAAAAPPPVPAAGPPQ